MRTAIELIDTYFYQSYADNWDDILFRERILQNLSGDSMALDLGAGSGLVSQMHFRGICRNVCGLDPVPEVLANQHLDCAKIGSGEDIPWADDAFDLVFADNVLEHLEKPARVFAEVRRVLRPGGVFLVKTPNRFHYVPLIAQVTPHSFHRLVNNFRGRNVSDTFPTHYRANSKNKLLKLAKESNLDVIHIECIEGRPEYMRSLLLYPFGLAWERVVNRFEFLEMFRVIIIGSFRKP
jgi:SAM-dependent methyltransferase